MSATAPAIVSSAAWALKRAKRDVGRTAPSRTAEIGGTRVARIAGLQRREQRDDDADRQRDDDRARGEDRSRLRQVDPEVDEQRVEPLGEAEPEEEARRRRRATPITNASSITDHEHLPPVRAERPQRGELARPLGDRDRERVRDHEACRRRARRRRTRAGSRWRIERKPLVSFVACFASACAVRTCAVGGRIGWISFTSCAGVTSGLRRDVDRVELALLVEDPLRGREVEDRHRRAAERRDAAELHDPDDRVLHAPGRARSRRSCRRPRSASSRRCSRRSPPRAARPARAAATSSSGLKRWSPFGMDAEREAGSAAARDHLAVAADERARGRRCRPSAAATPGSFRTFASSDSGNDGAQAVVVVRCRRSRSCR